MLYETAFKKVANRYKVVIGVRSPNPLSFTLLKDGFPSKNFHVKAKSSPTGPTAGFITEEPKYSKTPLYLRQQHINYINEAKSKGARIVDLVISKIRRVELVKNKKLISSGGNRYSATYPNGIFYFIIDTSGCVFDESNSPVKVISNPPEFGAHEANSMPITADYDLFTIIPRRNQNYNIRPISSPPILLRGNFNLDFLSPKSFQNKKEDVNKGNVHYFGMVIVNALNKEIKNTGYAGGKLIWHNDETGNPFSPGFDEKDKPIFFLPTGDVFIASSKMELIKFYSRLKLNGYTPEYSPRFGF
ncbi:hypothetical protein RSE70_001968 [Yersinia enterocolitica]|nr:anthrax toxin-like adenylyl cyclase domain-containing protein [Yersinia enterocolitica]ELI7922717.1 hypothetical protein [Yersinia enterocolitica]